MLLLGRSTRRLHRPPLLTTRRTLISAYRGRTALKGLPKNARTRFAPSPTGYLHLGSLRTALYNFLLAKATGGQFILRLEDTDKKRTVADAEQRLYQDLKWAGLQWDEGPDIGGPYGPYKQSERTDIYRENAERLLQSEHAYRCFCSTERLSDLAKQRSQLGLYKAYDRKCSRISLSESNKRASQGESHVVRLKMPKKTPTYLDLVYGTVGKDLRKSVPTNPTELYEDPILLKSDGLPTYHLANVVDDHYMGITHVIRATEWMPSTPKHILLYKYLGWMAPRFAHVGLLQNSKREKLSKRDDSLGFRSFEKDGIFPEALVNFVALFGWSHKLPTDVLSMQDLIQNFTTKFTKGDAIIEPSKLYFLQKKFGEKYIEAGGEELESMIVKVTAVAEDYSNLNPGSLLVAGKELRDRVKFLLRLDRQNYTTPQEFFDRHAPCLCHVSRPPYVPRTDIAGGSLTKDHVQLIRDRLGQITVGEWSSQKLEEVMGDLACTVGGIERRNLGADDVQAEFKSVNNALGRFLRWALTGGQPGPGIRTVMVLLGREVTLQRLREAQVDVENSLSTDEVHQNKVAAAV